MLHKLILSKKNTILFKAALLLFIYIFSIAPSFVIHNHKKNVVAIENATACEKKIFFGIKVGACKHESHITEVSKKCSLCDDHISTAYCIELYNYSFSTLFFSKNNSTALCNYKHNSSPYFTNRGPPLL